MKRLLLAFFTLTLVFASESRATAAPVEFYLEAYSNEGEVTGTLTIDTATGAVLGANLKVGDVAVFDGHVYVAKSYNRVEIILDGYWIASKEKELATMVINIEAKSLVGYSGGSVSGDFIVDVPGETGPSVSYFIGELTK